MTATHATGPQAKHHYGAERTPEREARIANLAIKAAHRLMPLEHAHAELDEHEYWDYLAEVMRLRGKS